MFKKMTKQIEKNELNKQIEEDSKILIKDELEVSNLLEELDDVIKGGKADTQTMEGLAKKHGVKLSQLKNQLEIGLKVEMEHTDDKEKAREIVMDHLFEFSDYYDRLMKMEKKAEKELDESFKLYEEILAEEKMPENPEYGLPDDKAYPLYDKLHVLAAIKLFMHVERTKERRLAKAIIRKMRFNGMRKSNVGENNRLKLYVDASNLPE